MYTILCKIPFQIDEAKKLKNTDIAKELSLPPVKLHCSMLAEDAIKAALSDYKGKQESLKKAQGEAKTKPETKETA